MNVLQRGFSELGQGWPESTPAETALPTDTPDFQRVSAKRVIEAGSLGVVRKTQSSVMTRDGVSRTT